MAKYSVLIADDQPETNRPLFERLFHDDPAFTWHIAESRIEFSKLQLSDFDAVLLDVNLDDWGMTLKEAFEIIGGKCPVVLVSKYWNLPQTHKQIAEALADSKMLPFVGTLVLNDLGREGWESHAGSMRSQLRLAIARYRQQGLLEVGESNPIRILHLSDPQYGDPGEDNLAFLVEKEIPRFVMGDLGVIIHFIVITGDLTYSGQPREYEIAEKKLKDLVEAFLPSSDDWRERILIVPGNHDVDLRLAAADVVKYSFSDHKISCENKKKSGETSHRSYALYPFRDFSWRLTGNPHSRDAVDLCWINDSFRHLGLRFYLLNSAALIDCKNPNNAQIPIETLNNLVEGPSERDRLFGIALAHHGPPTESGDGIESLTNWPQVGKLIQNSPIRLFIHGHGHKRLAELYPLAEGKPRKPEGLMEKTEIMRVMAPTTHLNDHKRPIGERRGFNLITLRRIHGDVEAIEVDSYELGEDKPHRAKGAPWTCRP